MNLSIVICTYNPDIDIFQRCLRSVTIASAYYAVHEILLIDNNSNPQIEFENYIRFFLRENANARILREEQQGLTAARLRGIKDTSGDLIIFVDDDNEVQEDYFAEAASIFSKYPFIGAFSGQVKLDFIVKPSPWVHKYEGLLVKREFSGNHWSNSPAHDDCMPAGAGLCITRKVALHYLDLHKKGKRKFMLDRSAGSLMSGGDNDLAMCSCDIGLGIGIFDKLILKHIIPPSRTTADYLIKLTYGIYYSAVILKYMRGYPISTLSKSRKVLNVIQRIQMKKVDSKINKMCERAVIDAQNWILKNKLD